MLARSLKRSVFESGHGRLPVMLQTYVLSNFELQIDHQNNSFLFASAEEF